MKVKMIKPLSYKCGIQPNLIPKGTVLEVRKLPALIVPVYQCIEGYHSGAEIPYSHCVEIEDPDNQSKVKLPKHIAEAIEICRKAEISDYGMIICSEYTDKIKHLYHPDIIQALGIIRDFSHFVSVENGEEQTGAELLIKALANGFTAEEPSLYQQIKEMVERIHTEWVTIPSSGDDVLDGRDLATRISDGVKELISKT